MRCTIAVTDFGWYEFLAARAAMASLAEINFWTPSPHREFRAPTFSPFFFKLNAPYNAIAGFGYFARWSHLPDWLAWECFGESNGCRTLGELRDRLAAIRGRIRFRDEPDAEIGCILVVEPTFFPRDAWVHQPEDWHARTVSGKGYDLTSGEGARVWAECVERVTTLRSRAAIAERFVEDAPRYGVPQLVAPRLGQGTFRVAVTEAYGRACAVTGEHSLPVLEAAHIRAFADDGPHAVPNGLLLRADLHRLFDRGYVTVTPEHRPEVSGRLREDYQNGHTYYPMHGHNVRVPMPGHEQPASEYLRWHNDHVYRR
jgi:putative restriction endonuclease